MAEVGGQFSVRHWYGNFHNFVLLILFYYTSGLCFVWLGIVVNVPCERVKFIFSKKAGNHEADHVRRIDLRRAAGLFAEKGFCIGHYGTTGDSNQ